MAVPFVNDEEPQHPHPAAEDDDQPSTTVDVVSVSIVTDENNSDVD